MRYSYKYRLSPSEEIREELLKHIDICRQLYNHVLYELNKSDGSQPSRYDIQGQLPELKTWWDDLNEIYAKVLQMVVKRVYENLGTLKAHKENGHTVGRLKWKRPRDYRSLTYNQIGFKLKNTSGRPVLWLSKIGQIPIRLHRDIPEEATIKQVIIKREPTGEWYAIFTIEEESESPKKPDPIERVVGIDVGILKYAHDTDGYAIKTPDLSTERDQLEKAHRDLSRKVHGSKNWEKQHKAVARCYASMKRKRHDFLHKLSNHYAREYDLIAVENLNVRGLVELPGNSRNRMSASWGMFLRMLKYKCKREGSHFVAVDPKDTTKECASCGNKTEKPLWVREHSCPACGFEADRDANAAWNIRSRGIKQIGVVHSESTPVETVLPVDTNVSAKHVIETGSPTTEGQSKSTVIQ